MRKGNLFVVSGPSGAGKSTVCRMVKKMFGINLATSATTREPREGEKNGVDYYFMTKEKFLQKVKDGDFLEHAMVHDHYYGTLKSEVESRLLRGEDVILEIDVQGGLQVKEQFPEAHMIFFKPPTMEDLEKRLRGRKTDDETTIQLRLKNAKKELEYEKLYDITIINNTLEQACHDFMEIVKNENRG